MSVKNIIQYLSLYPCIELCVIEGIAPKFEILLHEFKFHVLSFSAKLTAHDFYFFRPSATNAACTAGRFAMRSK